MPGDGRRSPLATYGRDASSTRRSRSACAARNFAAPYLSRARLTTDALGVHDVWANGIQVADGNGLMPEAPLAGELLTDFAG